MIWQRRFRSSCLDMRRAREITSRLTRSAAGGYRRRGVRAAEAELYARRATIPDEDLTITWTNILTGNGSTTMKFGSGPTWQTGCVDSGLQFILACNSGSIELRAVFFVSGSCPTGLSNYCSNLRSNPLSLTLAEHICSPFSLTFTLDETGCPELTDEGNTQFVITR